jgi:UDP-N-acetylmuramate dehydrogenase
VVTNAGAYGSALSDVLKSARLANDRGEITEMAPADLQLTYRESAFTRGAVRDRIVSRGPPRRARRPRRSRRASGAGPGAQGGAAGRPQLRVVFKNPAGEHGSWWYVDQAASADTASATPASPEQHTNFIQNLGGASAKDIVDLIRLAQDRVRERFGIELETEVFLVGEFA